ncbi:MAG: hypothetical protein IT374_26345 [Polyangiaceae bacterium]|nr:hypothetical protein [Polyangiaceae bacterium]
MITVTGLRETIARVKAIGAFVRSTSATGVEVVPAASDMAKAEALVRGGRDIFAVDAAMEQAIREAGAAELDAIVARAAVQHGVSVATFWTKIGDRVLAIIRGRIDDTEPTPGGKAPLKAPRRDGSTDHIGRDTGALYQGLVRRLTSGSGR